MGIVPTHDSDRARFWAKVDKNGPAPEHRPELGPCWLWTAATYDSGYGAFRLTRKQRRAHIVSFEWNVGPTNGFQVCHACDVRPCVNPAHLFLGTQKDNIQDAVSKRRMADGERNGMHTGGLTFLTDDQVREIHALAERGMYQQEIADQFGVSQTLVSHIMCGTAWGHLGLTTAAPRGKPRPSDDTVRAIRGMADSGLSYREIGATYSLSASAVWRIIRRLAYPDVE